MADKIRIETDLEISSTLAKIKQLEERLEAIGKSPSKFSLFNQGMIDAEIAKMTAAIAAAKQRVSELLNQLMQANTLSTKIGGGLSGLTVGNASLNLSNLGGMSSQWAAGMAQLTAFNQAYASQNTGPMQAVRGAILPYVGIGAGQSMLGQAGVSGNLAAVRAGLNTPKIDPLDMNFQALRLKDNVKLLGDMSAAIEKNAMGMGSMAVAFGVGATAAMAFQQAVSGVIGMGVEMIKVVDQIRLSAASMAGAMLISDPTMGFDKALKVGNKMIEATFVMSRGFVGNARELQLLTEAAVTFGLKLDFASQKGRDQFLAFANMLKLITQGQNFEIQAFQEVRAIMQGQNFQGAMLARRLQAVGVDVAKMVPEWVKQGTVIEEIVSRLGGYAEASDAIKGTLQAQLKTLQSVVQLLGMKGSVEAYDNIRDAVKEVNDLILGQQGLTLTGYKITMLIKDGWASIKDTLLTVADVITYTIIGVQKLAAAWEMVKEVTGTLLIDVPQSYLDMLGIDINIGEEAKRRLQPVLDIIKLIAKWAVIGAVFAPVTKGASIPLAAIAAGIELMKELRAEESKTKAVLDSIIKADQEAVKEANFGYMNEYRGVAQNRQSYFSGEADIDRGNPLAMTPSGRVPIDPDWTAFLLRTRKFAAKIEGDIDELTTGLTNRLSSNIKKARNQVQEEFASLFLVDDRTGEVILSEKMIKLKTGTDAELALYKRIMSDYYGKMAAVDQSERKKYNDAILKEAKSTEAALTSLTTGIQIEWNKYFNVGTGEEGDLAGISERMQKEFSNIEKDFEREAAKVKAAVNKYGLSLLEEEQILAPLREIMNVRKSHSEQEDQTRGFMDAAKDEARFMMWEQRLDELRSRADIEVKWSWNARDVGIMQAALAEQIRYQRDLNRLQSEADVKKVKGEFDPDVFKERQAALLATHIDMLRKLAEANDTVLKSISNMWEDVFKGIQGFMDDFWDDLLNAELKSLEDYWLAFNRMISKIMLQMLSQNIVDSMKESFLGKGKDEKTGESTGGVVGTAGKSFLGMFGFKPKVEEKAVSLADQLKQLTTQTMNVEVNGVININGKGVVEPTVAKGPIETGELTNEVSQTTGKINPFGSFNFRGQEIGNLTPFDTEEDTGPNSSPPQDVYDYMGNMVEELDTLSTNIGSTADVVKGSGESLGDSLLKSADMVGKGTFSFLSGLMNSLMSIMGGGGGEWNWWKEIGGGILKGIGMFAGMSGGGGSGGFDSSVAMDTEHLGMYGLKEGGIYQGGFTPIRAFASGGVVKRPTIGLVGEGGDDEAIIPLRGGAVPVKMQGKPKEQSVAIHFNIQSADVKDFDRLLYERKNMIAGIIRQELRNASGTRDEIRRYAF